MAGKTGTTKPTDERVKPGPKPGAKPAAKAAAVKPAAASAASKPGSGGKDIPKTGLEHLANDPDGDGKKVAVVEVAAHRKVFLESMAHALIFDIFQMTPVLHAIARVDQAELDYFLDHYTSRMRPLLIEDQLNGRIDGLLDIGVWKALDGQEEVLTEAIVSRLGGDISATPEQLTKLVIEAAFGQRRTERASRGEVWMPGRQRASSREDMARCAPRHVSDNAHDRRS